jgi:hypothetical protein
MDTITVFGGIWVAPVTYLVLTMVETRLYSVSALMSANRGIDSKADVTMKVGTSVMKNVVLTDVQ